MTDVKKELEAKKKRIMKQMRISDKKAKVHSNSGSGEGYKCKVCGRTTNTEEEMRQHVIDAHPGQVGKKQFKGISWWGAIIGFFGAYILTAVTAWSFLIVILAIIYLHFKNDKDVFLASFEKGLIAYMVLIIIIAIFGLGVTSNTNSTT